MSQVLITFNAGYGKFDNETKLVTPLPGKGKVTISRESEGDFPFFQWEARDGFEADPSIYPSEPLVLIPGDAKWIHAKTCKTGRVFALKFASSDQIQFYWMQTRVERGSELDTLTPLDKSIFEQITSLLREEEEDEMEYEEEEKAPSNIATNPKEATSSTSLSAAASTAPDLSNLLNSVTTPTNSRDSVPIVNISDALPTSLLINHINSLPEPQLQPLLDNLPDQVPKTKEELLRIIQSSQFSQGSDTFSNVLMQGGLGPIVARELGYPYQGEGVEGFLNGVRKSAPKKEEEKQE
jgi:26S proteasome regulatory subunit N13